MDAVFDLANNQNCWVAVTGKRGASSNKSIGSVFAEIDVDLDGTITVRELKKYFQSKNISIWNESEFRKLWLDADENRDNCITYEEFWKVM